MRGCRLLAVVVMTMAAWFYLGTWSMGWARPGDLKWKYPSLGGSRGGSGLVAIDSNGNRILVAKLCDFYCDCNVISVDKDGRFNWQRSYDLLTATSIAIDSKDNIIVVGSEHDDGDYDWKVISYSPSGEVNWERSYDSTHGSDTAKAVAIDSNDNAIVVGYENNGSDSDWKVISYSPSGEVNWERSYGSTHGYDEPKAVAIDSNDNVIVVGYENNRSDSDWKIISYSPSGDVNWQLSYDGGHSDFPEAVVIDSRDNAIVVGNENNGSDYDWKIISYSPSGGINWQRSYDSEHRDDYVEAAAIDSRGNVIVVGYENDGSDSCWKIISYSSSGGVNWERSYDSTHGYDKPKAVAIDSNDNAIVVGYENNGSDSDWKIISYSSAGEVEWQASYDSGEDRYSVSSAGRVKGDRVPMQVSHEDEAKSVCIDRLSGDVVVAGYIFTGENILMVDCEGYPPAASGHVLVPSEVRVTKPAFQTPDPDPTNGTYLGFGDVVANGTHFKVEAAFPAYINKSDNSQLAVKIFIAAQLPDDYSRLAFFDSSNNLKFQPPDTLSSWKSSVSGEVTKTLIFPETDVSAVPSGTHYWYTLVVPATVPDDFAGVDWSTTPWEITLNVFDVR